MTSTETGHEETTKQNKETTQETKNHTSSSVEQQNKIHQVKNRKIKIHRTTKTQNRSKKKKTHTGGEEARKQTNKQANKAQRTHTKDIRGVGLREEVAGGEAMPGAATSLSGAVHKSIEGSQLPWVVRFSMSHHILRATWFGMP